MNYYKISHDMGTDTRVIFANNQYEAVGYYIINECDEWVECLDDIETLPPDHEVEVSCVGFPQYKTLEEIYNEENKDLPVPCVVCSLEE